MHGPDQAKQHVEVYQQWLGVGMGCSVAHRCCQTQQQRELIPFPFSLLYRPLSTFHPFPPSSTRPSSDRATTRLTKSGPSKSARLTPCDDRRPWSIVHAEDAAGEARRFRRFEEMGSLHAMPSLSRPQPNGANGVERFGSEDSVGSFKCKPFHVLAARTTFIFPCQ